MSFVFDEVGTFIRCEQIRNELVEFGSGFVARKFCGFELDQFFRDLNKHVDVLKIRIQIANQVHGRAFWNHPGFDVPVTICERLKRFQHPRQKFLAQMQRAIVLRSPDGILIQWDRS